MVHIRLSGVSHLLDPEALRAVVGRPPKGKTVEKIDSQDPVIAQLFQEPFVDASTTPAPIDYDPQCFSAELASSISLQEPEIEGPTVAPSKTQYL